MKAAAESLNEMPSDVNQQVELRGVDTLRMMQDTHDAVRLSSTQARMLERWQASKSQADHAEQEVPACI